MYLATQQLIFAIALLGSAEAQLIPAKRAATATFCSKVKSVVTAAKAQSAATAFCASYLHLPSTVVTSTTSITTIKAPTSTVTTTITSTTGDAGTTTSTATVTDGIKTVTSSTCPAQKIKRATSTKSKPSCLNTYNPGATLSSACKCLSIPPITSTTSVVGKTTSTPVTTTTTTKFEQGAGTVTDTTTITVPSGTTTTNIPPASCTPTKDLEDGSFEDIPDDYTYSTDVTIGGWTFTGIASPQKNGDDDYNTGFGSKYARLYGIPGSPSDLVQTISVPSGDYQLSYVFAITQAHLLNGASCIFTRGVGNQVEQSTYNKNTGPNDFIAQAQTFTSTGGNINIDFKISCPTGGQGDGAIAVLVDNVEVTKV